MSSVDDLDLPAAKLAIRGLYEELIETQRVAIDLGKRLIAMNQTALDEQLLNLRERP